VRVAIIGVGLIGGSVGLAARHRLGAEVVGWDPDAAALDAAALRGAIDVPVTAIEAIGAADVALVAAPVDGLAETVKATVAALPDAIVTDVGSTKRAIVDAVDAANFIGGHPLAGAEVAGVEHAREDLFDGAIWYLTPVAHSSGVAYERLHRFISALGAVPTAILPADHDRVMASVSHLPHVLANVLVLQAAEALGGERMPATGPSFRDATRVAGANPDLWPGIYVSNRDALVDQLDAAIERLAGVRDTLAAGGSLRAWQEEAAERRRALLESGLAGGPVRELRVSVPNRPGVVAELALALGQAGINIADMSLSPSSDASTGVVALWVDAEHADRAVRLIADLGHGVGGPLP
jgi:prephenate dehydrogenase